MSIPRKVKVCGVSYEVRQVSGRVLGDAYGDCCPAKTRIRIDRAMSDESKRATLRHEIGHAAFHESISWYLVQLLDESKGSAGYLEEMLVRAWLPAYMQALQDAKLC
jgi:Zn-dependent peptidase ImmA (M78 family)